MIAEAAFQDMGSNGGWELKRVVWGAGGTDYSELLPFDPTDLDKED